MAYKQFALDAQTSVTIYKRRKNRSLRLSIAPGGEVRVSIPAWAPYRVGLEFAKSRQAWIEGQRPTGTLLAEGQAIGKAHRLHFQPSADARKVSSRVRENEVIVVHPVNLGTDNPEVQAIARKAGVRALRHEAERLLLQRLNHLALQHGFQYRSVAVKQLRGRWGSCDQHANIVLNLYLMQLSWECIDYVLLHELTHTQVLRHGPDFWRAMEKVLPDVKRVRKIIREHQPVLHSVRAVA